MLLKYFHNFFLCVCVERSFGRNGLSYLCLLWAIAHNKHIDSSKTFQYLLTYIVGAPYCVVKNCLELLKDIELLTQNLLHECFYGWPIADPDSEFVESGFLIGTFEPSCVGICTREQYRISLLVKRVIMTFIGLALFYYAKNMSRNASFHYTAGIGMRIFLSLVVIISFIQNKRVSSWLLGN